MKRYERVEACIKSLNTMYDTLAIERERGGTKSDKWDNYTDKMAELDKAMDIMQADLSFIVGDEIIAIFEDSKITFLESFVNSEVAYALSLWLQLLCEEEVE